MSETRIERFFVPTLEQLAPLKSNTVDDDTLVKVQAVLQRWQDDRDFSYEDALQACDELLGTCGIVSIDPEGAPSYIDEGIRMCPPFSYCNAGDTYATTLARDHHAGAWVVACWGDLLEELERDEKLGDHEEFDEAPNRCPSCGERNTFTVEAFERGTWEGQQWTSNGTGYAFVCSSCNHHCQTPEDWTPPEDETDEDGMGDVEHTTD